MRVELTPEECRALEAATTELVMSTEAGGANEGDEGAKDQCLILLNDIDLWPGGHEVEIHDGELAAIRTATQELAFSTEAGGANEGSEQTEAQVELLERLLGLLEEVSESADVLFSAEPRSRLSELAEGG